MKRVKMCHVFGFITSNVKSVKLIVERFTTYNRDHSFMKFDKCVPFKRCLCYLTNVFYTKYISTVS